MARKTLLIAIAMLLAIIGGVIYLELAPGEIEKSTSEQGSRPSNATSPPSAAGASDPAAAGSAPGAYIDYSADVIAQTSGTKLLFFYAPWCPQCRALEADIQKEGAPDGVAIIKVDYDSNQALRQKYGVTIQTTIVRVADSGELVEKYVAYDEPSLAAVAKELL